MDTGMYPNAEVRLEIEKTWRPVQLSLVEPDTYVTERAQDDRMVWTRLLVWEDHCGKEMRRSVGFLDVPRFLGQCEGCAGQGDALHARHRAAEEKFLAAVDRFAPTSAGAAIVPEGLFWTRPAACEASARATDCATTTAGLHGFLTGSARLGIRRYR